MNGKFNLQNGKQMKFKQLNYPEITVEVEDGTMITLRNIVVHVVKMKDKYDELGNPQYVVKSQVIMSVNAPSNLRRKPKSEPNTVYT